MPAEIILQWPTDFKRAHAWIERCRQHLGARLVLYAPKRTIPQNDRMWAMLTDVSAQVQAEILVGGRYMRVTRETEWWKTFFMSLLGIERETARDPTDPSTVVSFDRLSTSRLDKEDFSNLIEVMFAFGARAGVRWTDPEENGQRASRRVSNDAQRQIEGSKAAPHRLAAPV
jgi:hypothetical protein